MIAGNLSAACSPEFPQVSAGSWAVLGVIIFLFAMATSGTLLDLYLSSSTRTFLHQIKQVGYKKSLYDKQRDDETLILETYLKNTETLQESRYTFFDGKSGLEDHSNPTVVDEVEQIVDPISPSLYHRRESPANAESSFLLSKIPDLTVEVTDQQPLSKVIQLLLAWSMFRNLGTLVSPENQHLSSSRLNLSFFSGAKALCAIWIVVGASHHLSFSELSFTLSNSIVSCPFLLTIPIQETRFSSFRFSVIPTSTTL